MRLLYIVLVLIGAEAASVAVQTSPHSVARDAYFEENRGQTGPGSAFVARSPQYTVLLQRNGGAVYRFPASAEGAAPPLTIELVGQRPPAEVEGEQPMAAVTNYYRGSLPAAWQSGIPHYGRVRFDGVYPGIDVRWRFRGAHLEYEFLAGAGADPGQIRVRFTGASRISIDAQGNLVLETPAGRIRHGRPMAWQEVGGRRRNVPIELRLSGETASFQLGPYDRQRPLRIDPVLSYSSYVGGAGYDAAYAVTTDGSGGVYDGHDCLHRVSRAGIERQQQ